jgi:hypothetical protein
VALIDQNQTFDFTCYLPWTFGSAVGQSFTGNGAQLKYAVFKVFKGGAPTGTVYAKLYAHSGTYGTSSIPTGAVLATSVGLDISTLSISGAVDYCFVFASPYTLVNGTHYCIVIEFSGGDASNYLGVRCNDANVHSGNLSYYISLWAYASNYDLYFRLFDTAGYPAGPYYLANMDITLLTYESLETAAPASLDEAQGWTCDKKTSLASPYKPGTTQASTTFVTEPSPFGALGYRTPTPINNTFAQANFVLSFKVKSNAYYAQTGNVRFRLWRSVNANGSSATQITDGWKSSSLISFTAINQYQTGTITWFPVGTVPLTDEYLFLEIEWYAVATGGNNNAAVLWVHNQGAAEQLATPSFGFASYSESVSLGGTAGVGEGSGGSSLYPALSVPATAALSSGNIVPADRSLNLPGTAGLPVAAIVNIPVSALFSGNAGLGQGATLALIGVSVLGASAGLSLAAVLAVESSMSLGGNAAVGEGSGGSSLLPTLNIPATGELSGAGVVDIIRILGLPATAGLPAATLADLPASISLPGSAALDLVAALLAERALTLAGIGALNADGEVTSGPGQYYETLSLEAVAAAVKTALLDLLASQSLDGAGGISAAAIIQATAGALLSATGALTPTHILSRLGAAQFDSAAGVSLGTLLQAINDVLLTGSTALTPAALNAALGLLSLAVTASLTTTGGFDGFKDISLATTAALTATLIYEMGAPLGLACLASLTLQSSLTGSNLISLAATGQMQELAQIVLTQVVAMAGTAGQVAAAALGRSGAVSLPVIGGLAAAAELGLMLTCSLAGIASLATARQLDCAGFLLLESVSAFAPFFGPRVVRGYRLDLILNELELDLKLN